MRETGTAPVEEITGLQVALVIIKHCRSLLLVTCVLLLNACTIGPRPVPVEEQSQQVDPSTTTTYPDRGAVPPSAELEPLPAPPPGQQPESATLEPPPRPTQTEQSPAAVLALLDNADQYIASGRDEQALSSIERALRIDSKNPKLWQRLSQIRLRQQLWDQAIETARKSNLLASNNDRLRVDNWLIIAKALEGKGDNAGAQQAIEQARKFYQ